MTSDNELEEITIDVIKRLHGPAKSRALKKYWAWRERAKKQDLADIRRDEYKKQKIIKFKQNKNK